MTAIGSTRVFSLTPKISNKEQNKTLAANAVKQSSHVRRPKRPSNQKNALRHIDSQHPTSATTKRTTLLWLSNQTFKFRLVHFSGVCLVYAMLYHGLGLQILEQAWIVFYTNSIIKHLQTHKSYLHVSTVQ